MDEIKQIPVSEILVGESEQRLGYEDSSIDSLAKSISRIGIINPLVLARDADGLHLIAGHRRLLAAKLAGLNDVPCIVRVSEKEVDSEITFAENFFRKDLSPVELACAIKDCYEKATLTVKEIAAGFHRSEHWVHSMMAIADWPGEVQEASHEKLLSVAAASNLAIVTDETYRGFLVRNAVEQGATARTTASWLQAWRAMQSQEEAITAEPVKVGSSQLPTVPQAPCFFCSEVYKVNEVSHVPICGACIQTIRQVGVSGGG